MIVEQHRQGKTEQMYCNTLTTWEIYLLLSIVVNISGNPSSLKEEKGYKNFKRGKATK